jgi:hypothetical protein
LTNDTDAKWGSTTKPSGCTGGGQEFIYHTHHCAFVYESDTVLTAGTEEEHAPLEIECSGTEVNELTITIPSIGSPNPPGAETGGRRHLDKHRQWQHARNHSALDSEKHPREMQRSGLLPDRTRQNGGEFKTAAYEGTETIAGFKDEGIEATSTAKTTPTAETSKRRAGRDLHDNTVGTCPGPGPQGPGLL